MQYLCPPSSSRTSRAGFFTDSVIHAILNKFRKNSTFEEKVTARPPSPQSSHPDHRPPSWSSDRDGDGVGHHGVAAVADLVRTWCSDVCAQVQRMPGHCAWPNAEVANGWSRYGGMLDAIDGEDALQI